VIVGCYSLDLYCDGQPCAAAGPEKWRTPVLLGLTAERGETCRRRARLAGWRLWLKDGVVLCPACVQAGRSKPVQARAPRPQTINPDAPWQAIDAGEAP
jgi:hypothetical protein